MWGPGFRPMTALVAAVAVLAACSDTSAGTSAANQAPATLALVNGTLIDGTGNDPIADGVIVIYEERIVAVGASDQLVVPPDTPTVDVDGATMLPGFINAHVHDAYNEERLRAWAQGGVTTVRDLGTWVGTGPPPALVAEACEGNAGCGTATEVFAFRDEVNQVPGSARLVAAGPIIGLPRDRHEVRWIMESPEEATQTVNALIDDGADLIKLYVTEPSQGDVPTQETATAMVEAAHAQGVPVAAHVTRFVHLPYALEAGVDDLVHMIMTTLADDLLARVVDEGMYWVPTLELWQCAADVTVPSDNLRRFAQAGGNVALGTDFNGFDCDWELGMPMTEIELMLEADMTPMQIITAATQNGAHVCGLGDELGTLEAGKIADILVVAGDPLEDMQALTVVQMVVHDGVIIRNELAGAE